MTPQEMFDRVVKHLFRQNRKAGSFDGTDIFMCAYRDDQGGKCAVGCLIPDELYDRKIEGRNVGCELLMQRVLTIQPRLHIFGHIHAGYGEKFRDGTHFVNAAICTERYRPNNLPIVVEI